MFFSFFFFLISGFGLVCWKVLSLLCDYSEIFFFCLFLDEPACLPACAFWMRFLDLIILQHCILCER